MLAIDRDAIVEAVYADLADPLPTVVPAGVAGHDPDRCPDVRPRPRARPPTSSPFAYPDGDVPTVHIDFDESPAQEAMAELVADDLEAVGIPTELRPLPLEEYKAFVVSGDQELFSFGWIGAYGSPDAYLAPLFGSSANDNLTNYRSAQVDGLLERRPSEHRRRRERRALGRRGAARCSRPPSSCRSPSSAPRSWSPTVSRASRTPSTAPSTGPR